METKRDDKGNLVYEVILKTSDKIEKEKGKPGNSDIYFKLPDVTDQKMNLLKLKKELKGETISIIHPTKIGPYTPLDAMKPVTPLTPPTPINSQSNVMTSSTTSKPSLPTFDASFTPQYWSQPPAPQQVQQPGVRPNLYTPSTYQYNPGMYRNWSGTNT